MWLKTWQKVDSRYKLYNYRIIQRIDAKDLERNPSINLFGHTHGTWKFLSQELNPHHSSDPSHSDDNARSLTHCTTIKLKLQNLNIICLDLEPLKPTIFPIANFDKRLLTSYTYPDTSFKTT